MKTCRRGVPAPRLLAILIACLLLAGCTYPAPFSKRFTEAERSQLAATEGCARSKGAKMWDAYVHGADT